MCPVVEQPQRPRQPQGHGRPALRHRDLQLQGRQLQRPGRRGPAHERLRRPLRLRRARRDLRRPRQQLRRQHRRGLHASAPRARTTASGACKRGGILACNGTGTGTFCDAPVVTPPPEVCNNIDDNCDGQVDNGTLPGVGVACGSGIGTCTRGHHRLRQRQARLQHEAACPRPRPATASTTTATASSTTAPCPARAPTASAPARRRRRSAWACARPARRSAATAGSSATAASAPAPRSATARTTTATAWPTSTPCARRSSPAARAPARSSARAASSSARAGTSASDTFCVPERCAQVTCAQGQHCDENTGLCVDLCAGVVCTAPAVCMQGRCLDCQTLGCDTGQVCYKGSCQADKCAGVKCGDGTYCNDGKCVGPVPARQVRHRPELHERRLLGRQVRATSPATRTSSATRRTASARPTPARPCSAARARRCVSTTGKCAPDPCILMQCPTRLLRVHDDGRRPGHLRLERPVQPDPDEARPARRRLLLRARPGRRPRRALDASRCSASSASSSRRRRARPRPLSPATRSAEESLAATPPRR